MHRWCALLEIRSRSHVRTTRSRPLPTLSTCPPRHPCSAPAPVSPRTRPHTVSCQGSASSPCCSRTPGGSRGGCTGWSNMEPVPQRVVRTRLVGVSSSLGAHVGIVLMAHQLTVGLGGPIATRPWGPVLHGGGEYLTHATGHPRTCGLSHLARGHARRCAQSLWSREWDMPGVGVGWVAQLSCHQDRDAWTGSRSNGSRSGACLGASECPC